MNCHRIKRSGKPAGRLHSLVCAECRASQRTDELLSFGIVQLRKPTATLPALNRTLDALNLPNIEGNYVPSLRKRHRRQAGIATAATLVVAIGGWFCYMDWNPGSSLALPVQAESPGHWAYAQVKQAMVNNGDKPKPIRPFTTPTQSVTVNTPDLSVDEALTKLDPAPTQFGVIVPIKPLQFDPALRPTYAAQTLGKFVHENAHALEILRENLSTPYAQKVVRSLTDENDMHDIITVQSLSKLLYADAKWKALQGDQTGALHDALDLVEFGENVSGGGSLLARMVGNNYQKMGQHLIWRLIEQMSANDARAAARKMEAVMQKRSSLRTTIQWETLSGLAIRQDILRKPFWRWKFASSFLNPASDNPFFEHIGRAATLYGKSNWKLMQEYTDYMDAVDQDCAQAYSSNRPLKVKEPTDTLNNLLFADYSTIRFRDTECETQNALLTTALALHAFRLEHEVDPTDLQTLVPTYLSRVPMDPFRATTPLQYFPQMDLERDPVTGRPHPHLSYCLYSVGPDGIDQHGAPISGPYEGSRKFEAAPDSKGDIVAGINR